MYRYLTQPVDGIPRRRDTISKPFVYLKPHQEIRMKLYEDIWKNWFDVNISQILAVILAIPSHSLDLYLYMGDLHFVFPALNLSIILDTGILIIVQQARMMMFSLNMVDYPCLSCCPP